MSTQKFFKKLTKYRHTKIKKGFSRRGAIEPVVGIIKTDQRLNQNYYQGIKGDQINVLLATAAMNFKRIMNKWKKNLLAHFYRFILIVLFPIYELNFYRKFNF